jgi:uncharacterized membrane protein
MIDIIPNWHPIFVHFTVALLSISVVLFVAARFMANEKLRAQWEVVAQWNLWLGAIITLVTVVMGVVAYNTVAHDTPSHEAMIEHRNWALVTAVLFELLAIWSALRARAGQGINTLILVGLVVAGGLLFSTAWHGGEVVYRYGLGVMSLPKADSHAHAAGDHHHAEPHAHSHDAVAHDDSAMQKDDVENCELPEKATPETADGHQAEPAATGTPSPDEHHHDDHDGHSDHQH